MIKVNKDYTKVPESINYSKISDKITDLLEKKNNHNFSGYNYDDVKSALRAIYHDKCCFCEVKEKPQNYISFDVEHYRPKKEITEDKTHSGYYWLGYEWSNLLWSCHKCNRSYKKNQFPVKKGRLTTPDINKNTWKSDSDELLSEEPLLLNPELDNIDEHIEFNCHGEIISKSERGNETIKICGLDRLNFERKISLDEIFRKLARQLERLLANQNKYPISICSLEIAFQEIFDEIQENSKPESEFSCMFKNFYQNFSEFCENTKTIENLQAKIFIINAFNHLKRN